MCGGFLPSDGLTAARLTVVTGSGMRALACADSDLAPVLEADRLPYEVGRGGVRLMRRQQLTTVANGRMARRLQS